MRSVFVSSLPDDIKELVYRNGFELGHSTWESDVGEMVRRLGLDKQSPTPARTSMETDGKSPVSAVSGRFKASWAVAMVVVIAILAALLLYQRTRDQSSGDGIVASSQQPSGSSSQPPTEASSQPPSQTSPRPSAGPLPQPPVGFGVISLANLARAVEVCEQSSSGGYTIDAGYAGSISPPATTLQVPAGTYKLKFDKLFVQPIRVESGKTVNAQ